MGRCPLCKSNDQVAKVSGLVAAGTQGTSQTDLAAKLAPPLYPTSHPRGRGCIPLKLFAVVLVIAGFFCRGLDIFDPNYVPTSYLEPDPTPFFIILVLGLLILFGPLIYRMVKGLATAGKRAQQQDHWQKLMQAYNDLWYCYRDDIVFIERDGRTHYLPSGQVRSPLEQMA
jgi:hypothetical protein